MPEEAPRHRRALPVYIGAGGVATGAHYAVMTAAVELLGIAPVVATATGFLVGATIKYWLNYSMAFRSTSPHAHAVMRYILMLAVFLGMNTALFAALYRGLGMHYIVAQVLTTILLIAPGYLVSRRWVFRR